jgi:hypothetical protein
MNSPAAQIALLREHVRQQRIRSDVERHAEEHVGAALVQLARELAVADPELEQRVARRQRHLLELADVPGVDDDARESGLRRIRSIVRLIWSIGRPVRSGPGAPLPAVDRAELAALVGPLVPDRHAVLVQIAHVGVALQEPQQLVARST